MNTTKKPGPGDRSGNDGQHDRGADGVSIADHAAKFPHDGYDIDSVTDPRVIGPLRKPTS